MSDNNTTKKATTTAKETAKTSKRKTSSVRKDDGISSTKKAPKKTTAINTKAINTKAINTKAINTNSVRRTAVDFDKAEALRCEEMLLQESFEQDLINSADLNQKYKEIKKIKLSYDLQGAQLNEIIFWSYVRSVAIDGNKDLQIEAKAHLDKALEFSANIGLYNICYDESGKKSNILKVKDILSSDDVGKSIDDLMDVFYNKFDDVENHCGVLPDLYSAYVPYPFMYIMSKVGHGKNQVSLGPTLEKDELGQAFCSPFDMLTYKCSPNQEVNDPENLTALKLAALKNLAPEFFRAMQEDKTTIEKNSVVKGLNGDVAYRIGKCYLEGNILPINKKKARDFLSYGMVVGSVDCALAYVLFCMGLDFKEDNQDKVISNLYQIFLNCFLLTYEATVEWQSPLINPSQNPLLLTVKRHLALFNLLSIVNDARFTLHYEEAPFALPHEMMQYFNMMVREALDLGYKLNLPTRYKLETALGLMIKCTKFCEEFGVNIKDLLQIAHIKVPKVKKDEDPQDRYCLSLITHGANEAQDEYSIQGFNLISEFEGVGLENIDEPTLRSMSDLGFANATFALGANGIKNNEKEGLMYWQESANQGYPLALFNIAAHFDLCDNPEKAIEYGNIAVRHGMVYGYFVLYRAYLKRSKLQNTKLAYTYLRIAAEYMCDVAIRELKGARLQRTYDPLPFVNAFEDLEALAEINGPAALMLSEIYENGLFMPLNTQKSFLFQQKAIENGINVFYDNYKRTFEKAYLKDRLVLPPYTSYRQSLEIMKPFYESPMDEERVEDAHKTALAKLKDVVDKLLAGKTLLEQELAYAFVNSPLCKNLEVLNLHSDKRLHTLKEPLSFSTFFLKEELLMGYYNVLRPKEDFENLYDKSIAYTKGICEQYYVELNKRKAELKANGTNNVAKAHKTKSNLKFNRQKDEIEVRNYFNDSKKSKQEQATQKDNKFSRINKDEYKNMMKKALVDTKSSSLALSDVMPSVDMSFVNALLEVRSVFFKPNYQAFRSQLKRAVYGLNPIAVILYHLDFSSVCPSFEKHVTESDNTQISFDPDVFVSKIAQ